MSIKSLDRLKAALEACRHTEKVEPPFDTYWITVDACDAYIKELEAEIAERFMELPVDADGVPIKPGDIIKFRDDAPVRVDSIVVRCKDCKHLDDSEYRRWDNSLAECYGEPPLFCDLLSFNEWRMDGDRRVAETTFAEIEPDGFCVWGERRES